MNELKKIFLFAKNKSEINLKEILKLTNLAENYDISELADRCLALDKKKTINILNENNLSEEDNIKILRSFLYKLKRLKKIKIEVENKKSVDTVLSSFKPPIFWKDKEILKKQVYNWTLEDIKKQIVKISYLELQIKKNLQISNQIVNNYILENVNLSNN